MSYFSVLIMLQSLIWRNAFYMVLIRTYITQSFIFHADILWGQIDGLKSLFTWEWKRTHTSLRFQAGVKTSSAHVTFHFDYISKRLGQCSHDTLSPNSFLSKWLIWHPNPQRVSNAHAHWKQYPTILRLFISLWVNFVHIKISCRFKILFRSKWLIRNSYWLSFILTQFMWTEAKSWLNTKVRFSTEIKSHTGLSSFRLSRQRTLINTLLSPISSLSTSCPPSHIFKNVFLYWLFFIHFYLFKFMFMFLSTLIE